MKIEHKYLQENKNKNRYEICFYDFCGNWSQSQAMVDMYIHKDTNIIMIYIEDFDSLKKQYWLKISKKQAIKLLYMYDKDEDLSPGNVVKLLYNGKNNNYKLFCKLYNVDNFHLHKPKK